MLAETRRWLTKRDCLTRTPSYASNPLVKWDERSMPSRPVKFTQAEVVRLLAAAKKVGVNVRLEIRPDRTLVVTSGSKDTEVSPDGVDTQLDKWMKKHHANPT